MKKFNKIKMKCECCNRSDWKMLCKSCHKKYDSRLCCKNGHKRNIKNTHISRDGLRHCKICDIERNNK